MSILSQLWWAGVEAANGEGSVKRALNHRGGAPATQVLAVGKAAAAMTEGALGVLPEGTKALVVTKKGHATKALRQYRNVEVIESGHPIPDEHSLLAGQKLYERVRGCSSDDRLLLLVSGGASALAERLPPGQSLHDWQQKTESLIASGADIAAVNEERAKRSLIKSGRLLKAFNGAEVLVLAISDVQGDTLDVIGSGLGDTRYLGCPCATEVVASNATARAAIVSAARGQGIVVQENTESLYQDVYVAAEQMAVAIRLGPPGLYLWGGEPTIELPAQPGRGGRNQSLALALARELSLPPVNQHDPADDRPQVELLIAGTDGTDGPTSAAGGWIKDAGRCDPAELSRALAAADAGTLLAARDQLFVTGPTGTNVMDLALCLKR